MFSDIPTTTQAIIKLKAMRQNDNETILSLQPEVQDPSRTGGRTTHPMYHLSSGHGNVPWYYHTSVEKIDKKQSVLE